MPVVFEAPVIVKPEHIDALQHVNNIVYLQWAEYVAWQHSVHLGIGVPEFQHYDAAMVARKHELNYLMACFEGEHILLRTWLAQCDGLSLYRHYQFVRQSDQKVVFEGETRWVCIRLSTGRPMRMPEFFKQAYSAQV